MNVLEAQIIEFWRLSEGKDNHFNFKLFINAFLPILESKLARHGQLSYELYIESIAYLYDFNTLEQFVYNSEHTNNEWNFKDVQSLIFCPRYDHFRITFCGNTRYINLLNLYNKLNQPFYDNGILLVDECIHALHNSGFLINIESLRREYES